MSVTRGKVRGGGTSFLGECKRGGVGAGLVLHVGRRAGLGEQKVTGSYVTPYIGYNFWNT